MNDKQQRNFHKNAGVFMVASSIHVENFIETKCEVKEEIQETGNWKAY